MHMGQMLIAVCALSLLGAITLNTNTTLLSTDTAMDSSEFGITAVSLATSLVEEAMGKNFDAAVSDTSNPLTDPSLFTPTGSFGHASWESYRGNVPGTTDFNDFDDFDDLFLVYKSSLPADTAHTPGSDYEQIIPGIRSKYFVRTRVDYVDPSNLNGISIPQTRHKKLTVTVTRPGPQQSKQDTLVFAAVMSLW
jgi:hypothetical protein